jgi:hypothetical protein
MTWDNDICLKEGDLNVNCEQIVNSNISTWRNNTLTFCSILDKIGRNYQIYVSKWMIYEDKYVSIVLHLSYMPGII